MKVLYDSTNPDNLLSDRRRTDRKMFRTFGRLMLLDGNCIAIRTYDIGSGGIGIIASINMSINSKCRIDFNVHTLDHGVTNICVSGRVTHSVLSAKEDGFIVGLEFLDLQKHALQVITGYVSA